MVTDGRQIAMDDVRRFLAKPYEPGSFFDMVERFSGAIILRKDIPVADESLGGKPPWDPVLLSKLVLLQRKFGWSEHEASRRSTVDLQVKACLGLGVGDTGPSQPTINRHTAKMERLGLHTIYNKRFVQLVQALGLLGVNEPVLVDSVPVSGAGQVLDTWNLLGAAIRKALGTLARATGRKREDVAAELDSSEFLGRSPKGAFPTDWESEESRREFLELLVEAAARVRTALEEAEARLTHPESQPDDLLDPDDEPTQGQAMLPLTTQSPAGTDRTSREEPKAVVTAATDDLEELRNARALIDQIIEHDVERAEDGSVKGIVQRRAGGRPISATDPEMRHGRKSASKLIAGFKVQVMVSLIYGWILLTDVFGANEHDGANLPAMVGRLSKLHGLLPAWWSGDHAYGTLANHAFFDTGAGRSAELIARMPRPANGGRFTKDEFEPDWNTRQLTCPAGVVCEMRHKARDGVRGWSFAYPEATCSTCPLFAQCVSPKAKKKARTVFLVPARERLIRRHLERREEPEFRDRLSNRVRVEHGIARLSQCGGKQVHRFGRDHVDFDVAMSALATNLRRLGGLLRRNEELAAAARRLAFFYVLRWLMRQDSRFVR